MAAASRTALAPQHVAAFRARHLEGPKALSWQMRETSQSEATKAFCNKKSSAEEGKTSP